MTNTVGDAQIKLGLDASGVVTGIGEAKKSIDSLGPAARKAGDGIADPMDKASAATQRFAREVVKTEIALLSGGKQTAAYKQAIAELNGLGGNALKPYLDSLRATEQAQRSATAATLSGSAALNGMGMSAKQTAAALRQVPAQFTDIVVSLQGGQAPLTVLLQQGGQLKDVFGGVGNAARALGGYIAGLVNPFTVAAAAIGGVAFAFEKGAQEQREFQKALILTGNAAGVTANLLSQAAANIDAVSGATQGKASEALLVFVNAGIRGRESLERFTASAIEFERAGGGAIEKVAENFAKLGKDPLKASLELNDSMNFLTRSLYEQIKALEDQGRSTEAAKVAQEAYNAALNDRTPQLLQNLGLIERGWKAITDATKGAYDAALNVGRAPTLDERRKDLQFKLSELSGPSPLANAGGSLDSRRALAKELTKEYEKQLATLDAASKFDQAIADQDKRRAESVSRARADDELRAKYLDNEIAKNKELARIKTSGLTDKEKATASASVNKKYEDKAPRSSASSVSDSELTGLKARVQQEQIYLDLLKTRGLEADKLNEGERAAIRIQEELKGSITGRARAIKEAALDQAKLLGQTISQSEAEKAALKATDEAIKSAAKSYESLYSSVSKSVESIQAQIEKENEAASAIGKTKEQIADLASVRLEDLASSKDRLAVLAEDIDFSGALTARYREEAGALRALAAAKQNRAGVEAGNAQLADQAKAGQKAIDDFQSAINRIDSSKLDGLFSGALKGIDKLLAATETLADFSGKADKAKQEAIKKYGKDSIQVKDIESAALEKQLSLTSQIAGAAKSMYAEGSSAYKGLAVAQAGLAAASAVAAIANQGLGDPYTAFARIAAMAATMSQLGIAINGLSSSSAPSSNQGTGSVFGDSSAKSASIDNSLKLLETSRLGLKYSAQMANSLKNIEAAFAGVTNLVLRNGQIGALEGRINAGIQGSSFSENGFNQIVRSVALGGSGTAASLQRRLFGNRVSIQGSGILGGPQSFGDIQDIGFQGNYYADIETKKKFLGVTRSTTNSTVLSGLDDELSRQFTQIFTNMGDSVLSASKVFGLRTETINAALEAYIVDIGKIDLKGLNGDEIQEKLAAVFGAEFDKLSQAIIPGLEAIQQVGEGYGETLVRAATQLESVRTTFDLLGGSLSLTEKRVSILDQILGKTLDPNAPRGDRAQGGIAQAITADALVQQFGGLEQFNDATNAFYESFYSQGERTRATLGLLRDSLDGMGIALPDSIQSWRELTTSLDVTTESGRQAFEALITLGPAFADLQNQLLESAGISGTAIADVLRDGMLGRITQEDIGSKLSGIIVDGIYNSIAGGFAEQISQTFTSQIIAPLLQGIATTGALSATVSQASIDAVVASATNAANQLAAILNNEGFRAAIAGVQQAISGIAGAFPGKAVQNVAQAATSYSNLGSAVNTASDAAAKGADAWKLIGDSITAEIDRIRGELTGGDKASALASFATLTAQTRAGDLEAGKLLPSASQAYIKAVEESASSLLDIRRAQGFALSSLTETRAIIGQGPAVSSPTSFTPNFTPSYSPSGAVQQNSDALIAEVKLLRAEVAALKPYAQTTADVLDKASRGNQPLAVEVQT